MRTIKQVIDSMKVNVAGENDDLVIRGLSLEELAMILGAAEAFEFTVGPNSVKEGFLKAKRDTAAQLN